MNQRLAVEILVLVSIITSVVTSSESSWFGTEFSVLQKLYDDCQDKNDFSGCLKGKALTALSRADDKGSFPLLDGIAFVKQNVSEDVPKMYDSRALNGMSKIDRSLIEKMNNFFQSHTLKIDLSEARGKNKKMTRYVVAALMTAMGIAGPLGLKALAAIAGKALVISKVALTIAGIIALKKIFQSDHHEETSFQVHAGEHNRRNTYMVRPVKANPTVVDPYKYYYEHQYPTTHL